MTTLTDTARRALELARGRPVPAAGPRVIAVDGPSGSGKTTLAATISSLSGAPVVHMDDLYDGWTGLEAGVDQLVGGILRPLDRGESGSAPRYDWAAGRYDGTVDVARVPLLVVEGVGSGARRCAPYLTVLVWLEAPAGDRLERAARRDGEDQRQSLADWAEREARHHEDEGTRGRADLVAET